MTHYVRDASNDKLVKLEIEHDNHGLTILSGDKIICIVDISDNLARVFTTTEDDDVTEPFITVPV